MPSELETFTRAYIEAALWSSTYETEERDDAPMDRDFDHTDLSPELQQSMTADCRKFLDENFPDGLVPERWLAREKECTATEFAGYDFWLTRNGHGCGFWDGDWKEPHGTRLTDAAKKYPTVELYVGDDGLIYGV